MSQETELSIENLIRNNEHGLENVATRPYTEMWDRYLEETDNLCIWSPRMSGKTYALVNKFIETPNSVYITPHRMMTLTVQLMCQRIVGRDTQRFSRDIFSSNTSYRMDGRRVDRIFIDEISSFSGSLNEMWDNILPSVSPNGIITMVSTPNTSSDVENTPSLFRSVMLPDDYIEENKIAIVEKYFDEGLFRI